MTEQQNAMVSQTFYCYIIVFYTNRNDIVCNVGAECLLLVSRDILGDAKKKDTQILEPYNFQSFKFMLKILRPFDSKFW